MITSELIEALQQLPPDTQVVVMDPSVHFTLQPAQVTILTSAKDDQMVLEIAPKPGGKLTADSMVAVPGTKRTRALRSVKRLTSSSS